MSLFDRLFSRAPAGQPAAAAYAAAVAVARQPGWYLDGGVADTLDGRFDMVALVTSLLSLRLERDGAAHQALQVALIEAFVDDMDASIREMGIGDMVVGKHVGRMTGALGGRLGAYRAALAPDAAPDALAVALTRNLYRGAPPSPAALAAAEARVRALVAQFDACGIDDIVAGRLGGAQ